MIHRTGKISATLLYSPNSLPHVVAVVGERVMTSGGELFYLFARLCPGSAARDRHPDAGGGSTAGITLHTLCTDKRDFDCQESPGMVDHFVCSVTPALRHPDRQCTWYSTQKSYPA